MDMLCLCLCYVYVNGSVYDFSVDYDAIAVDDTLDIHKYLMKKVI